MRANMPTAGREVQGERPLSNGSGFDLRLGTCAPRELQGAEARKSAGLSSDQGPQAGTDEAEPNGDLESCA